MENSESISCTPPEISEEANLATFSLMPRKSRQLYEKRYEEFLSWCVSKKVVKYSENAMLAFFNEKSKIFKPNTLWSLYSMLKTTLLINKNTDISNYKKLIAFIKQQNIGYEPKKSKTLERNEIIQFLKEAPDEKFLMIKVALIFGISGACRRNELYQLRQQDIEDRNSVLIVTIPDTKTNRKRTFTVVSNAECGVDFLELYKKYNTLRQDKSARERHFFLRYENGKCCNQVIGLNTIGHLPQIIAEYLKLANPKLYTGHCFRRSSATLLADTGADLINIKRHGGWKSSTVAESYIDDSIGNKIKTATQILASTSNRTTVETASACTSSISSEYIHHTTTENNDPSTSTPQVAQNVNNSGLLSTLGQTGLTIQNCSNFNITLNINNCKHE